MKYGITGSTGQLGSAVITYLLDRGILPGAITAVARDEEKASFLKARDVDVRIADYGDYDSLSDAFAGLDRVLLISGSEVGRRYEQHRNVIDAAKAAGVGQIVYTSITRADSSSNVLAPEHRQTEEYLRAAGMDYVILRNNWYTENYIAAVQKAGQSGVIETATANGRVSSASRKEYAEAAACVLTGDGNSGKTYELAGSPWTFDDLAAAASSIYGKEITHRAISPEELVSGLKSAGLDEGTAGFLAALDKSIAEGTLDMVSDDLKVLLGRDPDPLLTVLRKIV